jgi:O-antigen ligase
MQTLAEIGVIGCLAYACLVGFVLWAGWVTVRKVGVQGDHPGAVTAFGIVVAFLVIGLIYSFNEQRIGQLFWSAVGLSLCSLRGSVRPSTQ